jgi:hypothetical protein
MGGNGVVRGLVEVEFFDEADGDRVLLPLASMEAGEDEKLDGQAVLIVYHATFFLRLFWRTFSLSHSRRVGTVIST